MEDIWTEIENQTPKNEDWTNDIFKKRQKFIETYSWAIPSKEAIKLIAEFWDQDLGIETGAGSGLWAYLLRSIGVNVIPTDTKEEKFDKEYTNIKKLNADDAIKQYSNANVLFLCWSRVNPTNDFKGNKIVYIGENEGGCTAGTPNENEWQLVQTIAIPKWFFVHDCVYLYVRK
jgi:hypothetical protein